jgi:hypothetical protein
MRFLAMLGVGLLAMSLSAAELNPKLLALIGPDASVVVGMDIERYRTSVLNDFFPWYPGPDEGRVRRMIKILKNAEGAGSALWVFVGTPLSIEDAVLDATTSVAGDTEGTAEAIRRWNQTEAPGDLAVKARRLAETYDNWFVADLKERARAAPALKYRQDLMEAVEEVSGGVRLGAVNEVRVEVLMKTTDDATALAALGRWLPGLVLSQQTLGQQSLIAEVADNLEIRAEGRVVSISLALAERKLEEMRDLMDKAAKGESIQLK